MQGEYETIGSWNVSLEIPEHDRKLLSLEFARWNTGLLPHDVARMAVPRELMHQDVPLTELYDKANSRFDAVTFFRHSCLAEHCMQGSTMHITPSPFIELSSYFSGTKQDAYQRLVENASDANIWRMPAKDGIIRGSAIMWSVDQLAFISDSDRAKYYADGKNPDYKVKIEINLQNKESYINLPSL